MNFKKAITLPEVLVAFLILVVGMVSFAYMYIGIAQTTGSARMVTDATGEIDTVLESIQNMNLTQIKSYKSNATYWRGLMPGSLLNGTVTVVNYNASDNATWTNDPLMLNVTISWKNRGATRTESFVTAFTDA